MKRFLFATVCISLAFAGCAPTNPDKDFDEMYDGAPEELNLKIQELEKEAHSNTDSLLNDTKPMTTADNQLEAPKAGDTIATLETNKGTIKFKIFEDAAPELSKNFTELANKGYYDGLTFHRVIENFMIQGGDPLGTGTGGASYKGVGLADEKGALALKHFPGAVSWAKSSLPNSIGSQFFIVHEASHYLDGQYSVFGQVFEGQDVVDAIAQVETQPGDKPVEDVIMERVTISTYE